MEKPKPMTANEAAHWMITNQSKAVCAYTGFSEVEYRFTKRFEMSFERGHWHQCDFSLDNPATFKIVEHQGVKPKTLEDMYREDLPDPFAVTDPDKCLCRAITRYIEQRLAEVAK